MENVLVACCIAKTEKFSSPSETKKIKYECVCEWVSDSWRLTSIESVTHTTFVDFEVDHGVDKIRSSVRSYVVDKLAVIIGIVVANRHFVD